MGLVLRFATLKFKMAILGLHVTYFLLNTWPLTTLNTYFQAPLSAYASWSNQSMTGFPQSGRSNAIKVALFGVFSKLSHKILALTEHPPSFEQHKRVIALPGQLLCR